MEFHARWLKNTRCDIRKCLFGVHTMADNFLGFKFPKNRQKWASISMFERPRTDSRRMTSCETCRLRPLIRKHEHISSLSPSKLNSLLLELNDHPVDVCFCARRGMMLTQSRSAVYALKDYRIHPLGHLCYLLSCPAGPDSWGWRTNYFGTGRETIAVILYQSDQQHVT